MFCPYVRDSCKSEECAFWLEDTNECSLVLQARYDADWYIESKEDKELGLTKVKKDLGKVLTKGFLRSLSRDPDFSDEDRKLILKLNGEEESLEKIREIKRQ